jgi:hypothetical protein
MSDAKISETQSILRRLETLSRLTIIVWIIAGMGFGVMLGQSFGNVMESGAFTIVGLLLGGLLGYFVGQLSAVFIDWSRQMLILSDKIAKITTTSEPPQIK